MGSWSQAPRSEGRRRGAGRRLLIFAVAGLFPLLVSCAPPETPTLGTSREITPEDEARALADSVSTLEAFVPAGMNLDYPADASSDLQGNNQSRRWVLSAASDSDAVSGTAALIERAVADGWVQNGPARMVPYGIGLNATAYTLNRSTPDGEFTLDVVLYPRAVQELFGHGSRPEVWGEVTELEIAGVGG